MLNINENIYEEMGNGLFELRERRYGYRIYYGFYKGQIIIVFVAGDKASQKKDIKLARKRLEILIKTKGL